MSGTSRVTLNSLAFGAGLLVGAVAGVVVLLAVGKAEAGARAAMERNQLTALEVNSEVDPFVSNPDLLNLPASADSLIPHYLSVRDYLNRFAFDFAHDDTARIHLKVVRRAETGCTDFLIEYCFPIGCSECGREWNRSSTLFVPIISSFLSPAHSRILRSFTVEAHDASVAR